VPQPEAKSQELEARSMQFPSLPSSTLSLMEVLYGLHPVEEALKAGRRRFDHVLVAAERHDARILNSSSLSAASLASVSVRSRVSNSHLLPKTSRIKVSSPFVHGQEALSP
jgi:tRNA G18 (ribose-2'-O)-methylase SpoU